MKRILLFALMTLCLTAGAQDQDTQYSRAMIKSHGYDWSAAMGWDYVSGLVTKSIAKYCAQHPDERYSRQVYAWCKTYADNALNADGSFKYFKKGSLDNIASGKVLIDVYLHEEAQRAGSGEKYAKAAAYLHNYLRYEYPRVKKIEAQGCFIHKDRYPDQMWLDGLYMGAAFYAEYLSAFAPDDIDGWSDIANQFLTIHSYTYDEAECLNYHAWSANPSDASSFWARSSYPHKGCSSEFWGRGMGWYFAALADVVELMPDTHPDRHWLVEIFQEVADGLKARQDATSGVWYQLLRYDNTFVSKGGNRNYLEASASCMFTYGFLKGLRLGILDENVFGPLAERAYRGLLDTFIDTHTNGTIDINNICRSAGLGPASDLSRDGSADYYLDGHDVNIVSNEGKGIGSFIMASLEYELRHTDGIVDITCDTPADTPLYDLRGIPTDRHSLTPGIYISPSKKILIK